jgi:subtilase family serine protease
MAFFARGQPDRLCVLKPGLSILPGRSSPVYFLIPWRFNAYRIGLRLSQTAIVVCPFQGVNLMALPEVLRSAFPTSRHNPVRTASGLVAAFLMLAVCAFTAPAQAQNADRVPQSFDQAPTVVLPGHHPLWATSANDLGPLNPNQTIDNLTMVLARSPEQQKAFDQFIEDQQNPGSPNYHHWLTAPEIGQQFGFSDHDISAISSWLTSQGLHIRFVTPDKVLIAFGGSAANIGRAFGTQMHSYNVHGKSRISVDSDPKVPFALAPVITAVRGFFTIQERPQHVSRIGHKNSPDITINAESDYAIGPADFAKIYDLPSTLTGSGVTIGIVSESRTNFTDFQNFSAFLGATLNNPTEIIPSASPFDGQDPGAAYTAPPACVATNNCSDQVNEQLSLQSEATLDVTRAGTIATAATIKLIAATFEETGPSEGVLTDAEYLAETTPAPAQIMTISFGSCESEAGPSSVATWNGIFQTAAAAGYSIFVSSGDSDAAGCDQSFNPPPSSPEPISPNSICSPQYLTCLGGTEFNDASDYDTYWSQNNGAGYESALSYIPEGAWNDPGDATNGFEVAGTGGGVSSDVATPSWQVGTGVPAAKAGRYTPDIAFSASLHDGYFGCLASGGGSCVSGPQGIPFIEWGGTSAAAPDMAGIAALLDQKLGAAQGNLSPEIYTLAKNDPSAFHDVTEASSGVSGCSLSTASMCNNSAPSATSATGGEAGYMVGAGYDEATGWGSLDVSTFIADYTSQVTTITPTVTVTPSASTITVAETLTVSVTVSGGGSNPTPTGSVTLTGGGYSSSPATLATGAASFAIPANSLTTGSDTLTVAYTPDSGSSTTYNDASGTASVTVDAKQSPTITVTPTPASITTAQAVSVTVTVAATSGFPTPTGSLKLSGGGYSNTMTLSSGSATFAIPGSTFAQGTVTLTGAYTPDSGSSSIYVAGSNTASLTVAPLQTPTVTATPSTPKVTIDQAFTVSVAVAGAAGFSTPTGSVVLTSGAFTSSATTLSSGNATINIAAGALAQGTDSLSVAYTPDSASSVIYTAKSGTGSVTVAPLQTPTVTVTPATGPFTVGESFTVNVAVAGTSGFATPTGSVKLQSGSFTSTSTMLSSGGATITIPANTLSSGGSDSLLVTYTPDSAGATIYLTNTGTGSVTIDPLQTPKVTVMPGATVITTGQSLSVTVSVAKTTGFGTPTGTVTITSTTPTYTSTATTLSNGSATITIPAGALSIGATDPITATYTPDTAGATVYASASANTIVTVDPIQSPTLTVTPSATDINAAQTLTVTITAAGTTGFGTPTGSVTLAGGGYTSTATALSSGTATITVPAGALAVATDTLTATYTPDSTSSPIYNSSNGTANVTVAPAPGFAPGSGGTSSISLAAGATTGNTGTISVVGNNGYSGSVSLTCAVTTSVSNVSDMPTCSLSPASITISGATASTSTLTIDTTAPGSAANEKPNFFGPAAGGTALALVMFFFAPRRRRNWLAMVALLVLTLTMGLTACGKKGNSNMGTTPGAYTVTVTGTGTSAGDSVAVTETVGTVALTVQAAQ